MSWRSGRINTSGAAVPFLRRFLRSNILVIAASCAAVGCSAERKVDRIEQTSKETNESAKRMDRNTGEMNENAKEMRSDTQKISENTKELNEETQKMAENLGKLEEDTKTLNDKVEELNKNVGSVNESTDKVRDEVNELDESLNSLSILTDALRKDILATYYDLRQGNALTIRAERLKALNEEPTLEGKVSEAAKYFMAFEFQLWKNNQSDSIARRDDLFDEGVKEFLWDIKKHLSGNAKPYADSQDNRMKNLYALSAAMHFVNLGQKHNGMIANGKALEPESMLTLLQKGLKASQLLESGLNSYADVELYQKNVLLYQNEALFLLQLRGNFYASMALDGLVNLRDERFLGLAGLFKKIRLLISPWTPNVEALNVVQIKTYTEWMRESRTTREFLASSSFEMEGDPRIQQMFRNLSLQRLNTRLAFEKGRAVEEFTEELKAWLGGSQEESAKP